jgi:ATP-dependent exoDNAse (exonuclease V) beta subunit
MVDSDGIVKWIISFLKKRKSPGSKSATANFISQCMHHMGIDEIHFNSIEKKPGYLQKEEEFIKSLFKGEDSIYFVYDSLYSCISGFCELIDVDPLKNHYVNHLLDMAFQFDLNFGPDLDLFVKMYDEKGKGSPVQIPESEDTMQIMTIHKSKGLEFPVVLLPECKMNPKESPIIDELDDFIVKLSASTAKKLPETAERAIAQENTTLSDELNTLYVAFTRASERMQISYKGEFGKDVMIDALYDYFGAIPEPKKSKKGDETKSEEGNKIYSVGQARRSGQAKTKAARELFEPRSLNGFLWFPDIALRDDQKLEETDEISEARRYGTQLHLALSIIEKKENINSTLEELLLETKIEKEFKERLIVDCEALFDQVLTNLYSSTHQVWNEQEIYEPESQESFRPDKIIENLAGEILVLDFKSGVSRKKDVLQVQEYKKVVAKLFNKPTKAALLYTDRLELEWVD